MSITFLSSARRVLLPFQESRAVNRENTYNIVISTLTQIELKSFPGIVGRYLFIFADVAFYRTRSGPLVQECYVSLNRASSEQALIKPPKKMPGYIWKPFGHLVVCAEPNSLLQQLESCRTRQTF
jgi:hypothetical protein